MAATDSDVNVVSYARISADGERDEHGVKDQHRTNRETAKRYGWRVVAEFTDNDKSAAKKKVRRDDFEDMLKVLHSGRLVDGTPVHGVVVRADDRLARRPSDYERFVDAITFEDGRVYADQQGSKDLYSDSTESMGLIGAVISKMEVRKMQRRMRNDHRRRAHDGKPPAGPRPFGWDADRRTLDPAEAPHVRKAVEQFIAGRSKNSIVAEWLRLGLKTPRGNQWTSNGLTFLLQNPRLCGYRMINGELVRDAAGEPIVGQWEPIITPEQWMAVNAIFEARKGQLVHRDGTVMRPLSQDFREHRYLLTGFLRCGRPLADGTPCGTKLRIGSHPTVTHHVYTCPSKTVGGCGSLSRRGDKVDEYISEAVLAQLEKKAMSAREIGPWPGAAELAAVEKQKGELREQFRSRKLSAAVFADELEFIEGELARLRREREGFALISERAAADTSDIRRRWYSEDPDDQLDISQKRAYIREALAVVFVLPVGKGHGSRGKFDPDMLQVHWRD